MRKIIAIITVVIIAFAGTLVSAEEVSFSPAELLKDSTATVVGVALSSESAGVTSHSYGPGFFVKWEDSTGTYLLVSGHLFSDGSDNPHYSVYLPEGARPAKLESSFAKTNISLIKLHEPYKNAKALDLAGTIDVALNQPLFLIYSLSGAFGYRTAIRKLTAVSIDTVDNYKVVTTELDLSPSSLAGASGGLVFTKAGGVVGILQRHTLETSSAAAVVYPKTYISNALRIMKNKKGTVAAELKPSDNPGWFGAVITANNKAITDHLKGKKPKLNNRTLYFGAFISGVLDGSPAQTGKFKMMDLLYEMNGIRVSNEYADVEAYFASLNVGDSVTIKFLRYNIQVKEWDEKSVEIVVVSRPPIVSETERYDDDVFKFQAVPLSWDLKIKTFLLNRFEGVYITKVKEDSLFKKFGIEDGTVILKVNGTNTPDLAGFKNAIQALHDKKGEVFEMLICLPDGYNRPLYRTLRIPVE